MISCGGLLITASLVATPAAGDAPAVSAEAPPAAAVTPETRAADAPPTNDEPDDDDTGKSESTVLVLNLRALEVPETTALALTTELADAIAGRIEGRVVTAGEIGQLVTLQKALGDMGCDNSECIANLTRAVNARYALSGSIGQVGSGLVLSLSLLDVEGAVSAGSASRTALSLGALMDDLPAVVAELFGLKTDQPQRPRYRLPEGRETSFAVFDLKPLGIDEATAQNLTQVLAVEIKKVEGTRVVSRDDIASMLELEAEKDRLACSDDTECLAEIGGALGVELLVVGHAGKLGDRFVASLRLIRVGEAEVVNRVNETFSGAEEQLLPAIRTVGRRLLGLEAPEFGGLAVTAAQGEAAILFDEEPVGRTPRPPLLDLPAGRHALRLNKNGFYPWRSDVFVEPGVTNVIWIEMEERPSKWPFWTALGGTLLAVVTGTVLHAVAQAEAATFRDLVDKGTEPGRRATAYDTAVVCRDASYGLWITSGVFALATGAAAIFTDWD